MSDAMIAALKAEREGYVLRGKTDRVAAVDAELKRLGVTVESVRAKPAAKERAVKPVKTESRG